MKASSMNVKSDVARVPGWYGKLPSLGDFASRRLEADFIEPWDLWLGEGLQAQRGAFGDAWLGAYDDTPPWRFLLAPGALRGLRSELAFAGVLVPSVDRVGRHFPLTIVASMPRAPALAAEFDAVLAWLHRLEDTALDALQGDWTIDDLENELADFGPPGAAAAQGVEDRLTTVRRAVGDAMARRSGFVDLAGVSSRADLAAIFAGSPVAEASPRPPARGLALWIADSPGRSELLVSDGLPSFDEFVRMFSGGSGARSAGGARPAEVEADDPLATRPMGLGVPLVAGTAPGGDGDLLSMFGSAAPAPVPAPVVLADAAPPPRELLPDDDILALYQVGGDSFAGALFPPSAVIPEHDVLGLYAPAAEPQSAAAPLPSPAQQEAPPRDDDILAMFSATDSQAGELAGEALPARDELLGMFEVPPQTVPFGEAPAPHPPGPAIGGNGEPDILDMFGVPPAKAEGKEAK